MTLPFTHNQQAEKKKFYIKFYIKQQEHMNGASDLDICGVQLRRKHVHPPMSTRVWIIHKCHLNKNRIGHAFL